MNRSERVVFRHPDRGGEVILWIDPRYEDPWRRLALLRARVPQGPHPWPVDGWVRGV